jgi:exosome complex protein LRP1
MDTKSVLSLVEQLQDDIEDLEENLEPLLAGALATTTKRLPLLDRAKLNAILVYSIESLLFCEFEWVDHVQKPRSKIR